MDAYIVPVDLTKHVVIVTGGNVGIGYCVCKRLLEANATVILACRSKERANEAVEKLKSETGKDSVEYMLVDFADLDSIRPFVTEFRKKYNRLNILVNNAGIINSKRELTKQGFNPIFATNHLGHYLLTRLLLDMLIQSSPSRIVNVSSLAHNFAQRGIQFDKLCQIPSPSFLQAEDYGVSKLCNILFSKSLSQRLIGKGVTTYAVHPGPIDTELYRNYPTLLARVMKPFLRSIEYGAKTILYCATAPEVAQETGRYYADVKEAKVSRYGNDISLAEELWMRSAEWVGLSADLIKA